MIELKEQYPYIDENGVAHSNLVKHWAEDGNGKKYLIQQIETSGEYGEAIDLYPCKYTYQATDKPIDEEEQPAEEE